MAKSTQGFNNNKKKIKEIKQQQGTLGIVRNPVERMEEVELEAC